jgi:predicted Zn-dependent protease
MSHHYQLSPEIDLAIRSWIRRHKRVLRLGCFGSQLLSLKFTRDHERAADDLGWELLQNAQINPQGMINLFAELKAEMDAKGNGSFGPGAVFLSTHPTPRERIERLGQKKGELGSREFKSFVVEFKALQAGLRMIP